jgi:hypothetical protein
LLNLQKLKQKTVLMERSDLLYSTKNFYQPNSDLLNLSTICRLTSFLRITPDFFIGGVQKGGTTSLYAALIHHPQIIPGKFKEVYYYGNNANYSKGLAHYKQFFATSFYKKSLEKKSGKPAITLDATTNTFENKEAPERILKDNPNAKIIFILRDPVERAFSHYKMAKKKGWEKATFEQALELEEARIADGAERAKEFSGHNYAFQRLGYRSRSTYINSMTNWFYNFPKKNILVLNAESFFSDPQSNFDKVCDFLGIERTKVRFEKLNEGSTEKMSEITRADLKNYFKPHNEELFKLLNTRYDW